MKRKRRWEGRENGLNKNVKTRKCKRDGSTMVDERHTEKRSNVLLKKRVPNSWQGKWKMLLQAFAYTEF